MKSTSVLFNVKPGRTQNLVALITILDATASVAGQNHLNQAYSVSAYYTCPPIILATSDLGKMTFQRWQSSSKGKVLRGPARADGSSSGRRQSWRVHHVYSQTAGVFCGETCSHVLPLASLSSRPKKGFQFVRLQPWPRGVDEERKD